MPNIDLPLTDSIETLIYRVITTKLSNDPVLTRVVRTMHLYLGSRSDSEPVGDVNSLPYLLVYPGPNPSDTATERHSESTMIVTFEIGINGTNASDLLNLWSAIRVCLFPGDGSMKALMDSTRSDRNEAWVTLQLGQPIYAAQQLPDGSQMLSGTGAAKVTIWQSTAL